MKLKHAEFLRLSTDDQQAYRDLHGENFEERELVMPVVRETPRSNFLSLAIRVFVVLGVVILIFWHQKNLQIATQVVKTSDHDQGRVDAEEYLRMSQMADMRDIDFKYLKSDVDFAQTNQFAAQDLPGKIKNFYNQLTSDEADFASEESSQLAMARNQNKGPEYIEAMKDVFEVAKAKLIAHDADMRAELPPI